MRQLLWRSESGDRLLYLLASLVVVVAVCQSALYGQDEFSIHKARPMAQEPPKDAPKMDFSIHQMEAPISQDEDLIGFSVHNAKPFPKPDVGDASPCTEQRTLNRVLVFVDKSKKVEQRNVQFCEKGKPCRWVLQNIDVIHAPSQAVLKELQALAKDGQNWSVDDEEGNECVHFKVIDITNPVNVDIVRELQINPKEVPLLVKESEDGRRKRADGMKKKDLADWYLKQFVQPIPESQGQASQQRVNTLPAGYHAGHNCPRCGRMQYDIHNDNGPVANSHIHRCSHCGTSWYHADAGKRIIQKPVQYQQRTSIQPSLGYPRGSFQGGVAQYALAVAQQTARAPPPRASFSSDPKKAAKEEKKWKEKERERIRKEVRRKVWSQYATFDPFTWLTIIQILIQVFQFIFDHYGLN